jgi:hypothetical protein
MSEKKGKLFEKAEFWREEGEFGNNGAMWIPVQAVKEAEEEFPIELYAPFFSTKEEWEKAMNHFLEITKATMDWYKKYFTGET